MSRSPSSASSVHVWLHQVPTPLRSTQELKRKSRNPDTRTRRPAKRPRAAPLQDIGNNIATMAGRARATKVTRTPRRGRSAVDVDADMDATPRAPSVPLLPPSQSSSRSSARSQSPSKISGLRNMQGGLEYGLIDTNEVLDDETHVLHALATVLEKLDDISQGASVLPAAMKDSLTDRRFAREFRRAHHFDHTGARDRLGHTPDVEQAAELCALSEECEVEQEPEAAWNCAVHWPVASLALKLSTHAADLKLKNITTARIQPSSLMPSRISGAKLQKKMVDFAYVFKPTPTTAAGFRNLDVESDAPSESFNHTCLNTIIDKPIAISIETKAGGTVASDEGLIQLSVWVYAHIAKLRSLNVATRHKNETAAEIPPLLLVLAHGAKWSVLAATQDEAGQTKLWRYRNDFQTTTRLGVYQVVAVLQLLLDWAQTQFRPWWNANALPLTLEQKLDVGPI